VRIGLTISVADLEVVPAATEIVPDTGVVPRFDVVIVNVAEDDPAGIRIVVEAVEALFVSVTVTNAPVPTAAPLSVIVPVLDVPLATVCGDTPKLAILTALTLSVAALTCSP
jgi:hypothetical protein